MVKLIERDFTGLEEKLKKTRREKDVTKNAIEKMSYLMKKRRI